MAISSENKERLNRMNRDAEVVALGDLIQNLQTGAGLDAGSVDTDELAADAVTGAKIDDDAVDSEHIASGAIDLAHMSVESIDSDQYVDGSIDKVHLSADCVDGTKLADDAVSEEHLDAGCRPNYLLMAIEDAKTTSREENVAGLSSALALDASLFTVMNAHAADGAEHYHGSAASPDTVNFPLEEASSDLATLIVAVTEKITAYVAHDADAASGSGGTYHNDQIVGGDPLASAAAPTDLQECITRLNDIKAKLNLHDADATGHTTGSTHQEATADAAYGAAILVADANVASGDLVSWSILNSGTGTVTGVSAVAAAGGITFTFSADPQNDAIISYVAGRAIA